MRAVVTRVSQAAVYVKEQPIGAIDHGLLVLLSVGKRDVDADERMMVGKIVGLRIFCDPQGKMNLDIGAVAGDVLLISQFTLHGDMRKGKRPSFMAAMAPEEAERRVRSVAEGLRAAGLRVAEGQFAADMQVHSINDGPVTILIDTKKAF